MANRECQGRPRCQLARVVAQEHFTVDGTLLEARASLKSFQRKDKPDGPPRDDPGNPMVNFRDQKRSNQTHESKSNPEALLARKGIGKEAKLSYSGNLLVENRNGLIVSSLVWEATGDSGSKPDFEPLEMMDSAQKAARFRCLRVWREMDEQLKYLLTQPKHRSHRFLRTAGFHQAANSCPRYPVFLCDLGERHPGTTVN